MIVVVEERELIASGFKAMFAREGVAASVMDGAELDAWIEAADGDDVNVVDMFLIGGTLAGNGENAGRTVEAVRRRTGAPVIGVAEGPRLDATLALFSAGCDDVVRAPIHVREILARAAAIRCRRRAEADPTLRFGALTVHMDGRDPLIDGVALALPRRERRVLEVLAGARGRFVTKPQLFSAVYGLFCTDVEESVVESHVSKLRRKLRERLGRDPIEARRFQGYAFAPASAEGRPDARVAA